MTAPEGGTPTPTPHDPNAMPPIPVMFGVGLSGPDANGLYWAVLQADDGTVRAQFRMPWQVAPQVGQSIAQGLTMIAQQAEQKVTGGLILPHGPGQLLVPGGARVNGDGRGE